MGSASSCFSASSQVHPNPAHSWKQLIDADDALQKYVQEQTLNETATDGEIELRALLDDKIGYAYLMDFADSDAKSVLTCWTELGSAGLNKVLLSKCAKIISMVCNILDDDNSKDMSTMLTNLNDENQNELFRISVIVRKAAFSFMYQHIFIPFKESNQYKTMCQKMRKTFNIVNVDDFDYYSSLGQGAFGVVLHVIKKTTKKQYAMKYV